MFISDPPSKSPSPPPPTPTRGPLPPHFHCSRRAEDDGVIRILLAGEFDLPAGVTFVDEDDSVRRVSRVAV